MMPFLTRILLACALPIVAAPAAWAAATPAPAVDEALASTRHDIDIAAAELEQVRNTISAARIPLAAKLQRRQAEILALRSAVGTEQERGRRDTITIEALRTEVRRLREDAQFVETMLDEYRRGLETRIAAGEVAYLTALLASEGTPDQAEGTASAPAALADRARNLFEAGMRLQRERVGGLRAPGAVLDGSGEQVPGAVVTVGPLTFFAAADGPLAGPAATQPGRLAPTLLTGLSPPEMDAVAALVKDGSATVPVDVTPGMDAAHIDQDADSFVDEMRGGGAVMIPLLAVGLIAIIVTLWKLVELRTYCMRNDGIVARVLDRLQAGDEAAALRDAATLKPPLGDLLRDGIAHRHAAHEHLEEILHEHVMAAVPRLERHLGTLAVLAGVAPLLGLLGTVTGMIHTFQLVTLFGTGEARMLSGGISEALITTKFGLSIAIPALLAHAFLARRVRTLASDLEASAMTFVAHLKRGRTSDG